MGRGRCLDLELTWSSVRVRVLGVAHLAISVALAGGCAHLVVPEKFPKLNPESERDALVVVTRTPGAYLPQFEECKDPGAICIDPPPFWFRAQLHKSIFGIAPQRFVVSTTDHFGMEIPGAWEGLSLLRLHGDGETWIMPRYAQASVSEKNDGEFFVVLWSSQPIWWLPCDAMVLAEPIRPVDFNDMLVRPLDYFSAEELESGRKYLEEAPSGVIPKLGLSMSKLSRHLNAHYQGRPLPDCRSDEPG